MKNLLNSVLCLGVFTFSISHVSLANKGNIVVVDGSSTVFPVFEAIAEEFGKTDKSIRVTVGTSGTGGGFKKFCLGETDISTASRPIKKSEIDICKKNGVNFVELPVAFDGLTVVVSKGNKFIDCLKTSELKSLWEQDSKITNWNQLRPEFPNKPVQLFGPGADSGTFDYFTEVINGKEDSSRKDFTASEDDNMLVRGVQSNVNALGYFGFAYYLDNQKSLKALKIDSGAGCVEPSVTTIQDGSYKPLSRPLFMYVSTKSIVRPEVEKLVTWTFEHANEVVNSVGYIALTTNLAQLSNARFKNKVLGSVFETTHGTQINLEKAYSQKK
jgi:phosphate transport system substrate-binding protein